MTGVFFQAETSRKRAFTGEIYQVHGSYYFSITIKMEFNQVRYMGEYRHPACGQADATAKQALCAARPRALESKNIAHEYMHITGSEWDSRESLIR